jgi:hypothetical protein
LGLGEGPSQTQTQGVLGFHTASLAECFLGIVHFHLNPSSQAPYKLHKGIFGLGIKRDGVETAHHPFFTPKPKLTENFSLNLLGMG